ncbi:MAG: metallophosphoesterase [Ignavibacteriaceae bacterium]
MVVFFSIFFSLYGAINFYIFMRGWQALSGYPHLRIFYTIIFVFAALAYIISKFFTKYLPAIFYDALVWIGSFWFAFFVYLLLSIFLIDVLRLLNFQLHFFPSFVTNNYQHAKHVTALAVFIIVATIVLAGYINTRNVIIKNLELTLPKKSSSLNSLNAVLVSDIHLSPVNNEKFLEKIVDTINELNPDIIFIAGDLVDEKAALLKERKIGPALLKLKSKYGIYACTGNHEYINGAKSCISYMKELGLNVLDDSSVKIYNDFYIAGRNDRAIKQFTGKNRKSLEEILSGVDKNYPVILMDHTPFGLDEAEKNGVDLQLSGHTHYGQMFPANFITNMIYEISFGYLKKGSTQYYISCGAGTWGPPVRTGSRSEIVNLEIKFVD